MEMNRDYEYPLPEVTRFEVIDHRKDAPTPGRVVVAYDARIQVSTQDDGRTMKVFLSDPQ